MAILTVNNKKFANFVIRQIVNLIRLRNNKIFVIQSDIEKISNDLLEDIIRVLQMSHSQKDEFLKYVRLNIWKVYYYGKI